MQNQTWWPKDVKLNLTIIPAVTAYDCWYNAQDYVKTFTDKGAAPVALVGPQLSDGMMFVR